MTTRAPAALGAASVALLAVLSGCGDSGPDPEIGTIRTEPMPAPEPELPAVRPVAVGDCPYLSESEASDLVAEPVGEVRIDESVDPAACFFYGAGGTVTLTTTVYTVDSAERAGELVAETAGIDGAEQIDADGGWSGAASGGEGGALVVLSRDDQLLAVQTADVDVSPAQRVAELVAPRVAD